MKPKDKVALIAGKVMADAKLAGELIEILKTGTDVEKGTCADVLKHVSKEKPEALAPFIGVIISYIDYKAPRVKWGVPECIGNMAQKFPKETEKAIPKLLENAKDESTVVRLCAAFALTQIARNNPRAGGKLAKVFAETVKKEKNNGVRNVYLKALKEFEKA